MNVHMYQMIMNMYTHPTFNVYMYPAQETSRDCTHAHSHHMHGLLYCAYIYMWYAVLIARIIVQYIFC